jgi:hypothetical protein
VQRIVLERDLRLRLDLEAREHELGRRPELSHRLQGAVPVEDRATGRWREEVAVDVDVLGEAEARRQRRGSLKRDRAIAVDEARPAQAAGEGRAAIEFERTIDNYRSCCRKRMSAPL